MKNKLLNARFLVWKRLLIFIMKAFIFLLCTTVFSFTPLTSFSQEKVMIDQDKLVTVDQVFKIIKKQTDYHFIYPKNAFKDAPKVRLTKGEIALGTLLNQSLLNNNLGFELTENNTIVIKKNLNVQILIKSQEIVIKGTVSDKYGMPLPGASIVEKGTTNGTTTDFDGNFSFEVSSSNSILVVSYIGFTVQEIPLNGNSVISVELEENASSLEEIVIVGFGTTTKAKSVGAVSTVKGEKFEQTPFNNTGDALQGQVAGLIVQNSGGAPNSSPSISIRGGGTPLYVIDGVVRDEFAFSTINPEDIKSMSVLKDAVSTAVYGTRAGNGIILVETKKGSKNKINFKYSGNYQISQPTFMPEMIDSYNWALMSNDAAKYDGIDPLFSQEQLQTIKDGSDQVRYPSTNWQDLVLRDFSPQRRHNFSMDGGDSKTNYFVSLGYLEQDGILKSNAIKLKRFNVRSNVNMTFEEIGLDIGLNLDASLQKYREPSIGEYALFRDISFLTSPMEPAFNPEGQYASGGNPLARSDYGSGYSRERNKYINAQLSLNWKLPWVDGLTAGMMGSYRDEDEFNKKWNTTVPRYNPDGSVAPTLLPSLQQSAQYEEYVYFQARLAYDKTFAEKHTIGTTLVYEQQEALGDEFEASKVNFESTAVDQLFAGPADGQANSGTARESAYAGYVGRVKYDYDGKYILELSGRYDGNDNFSPNQRWGFFPAAGAAWVLSKEPFMANLKEKNIFNNLKLGIGYGVTGVTQGVDRFGYISNYSLEPNVINIGNTLINGFSEGKLVSPEQLTWFERKSTNVSLDFASLNHALQGTIAFFNYSTSGYLVAPKDRYSETLGKDLPEIKSNSVFKRAGWELSLSYKKQLNNGLKFSVGGNMSYFDRLWESKQDEDLANLKNPYTRQTQQLDFFDSRIISDGYYQDDNSLINTPRPTESTSIQLGDRRYQDVNGDGKIDDDDKRRIGKPDTPHFNYGISGSLNYKAWSMNLLFQGTGTRYADLGLRAEIPKDILRVYQLDYWSPENPNARFQRISNAYDNPNGQLHDGNLVDAKYFRLKNLQFGFDFKEKLLSQIEWISGLKMFLTGTNLFTVSSVDKYFDPESRTVDVSKSIQGQRSGYDYPIQRTFTLGLNVEF